MLTHDKGGCGGKEGKKKNLPAQSINTRHFTNSEEEKTHFWDVESSIVVIWMLTRTKIPFGSVPSAPQSSF